MKDVDIDKDAETAALDHIYRRFCEAFAKPLKDNAVVIADVGISRHHCKKEASDFLAATNLPVYGTPLGKTVVDETNKRYGGVRSSLILGNSSQINPSFYRFIWGT